jgi:hypothetical protein
MVAFATDDGFVIALPYGPGADWVKNVLASGSATIVNEGDTWLIDHRSSFQQPWPRRTCRSRSNGDFAGSPSTSASGFAAAKKC